MVIWGAPDDCVRTTVSDRDSRMARKSDSGPPRLPPSVRSPPEASEARGPLDVSCGRCLIAPPHETHLPAPQPPPRPHARLPRSHGDERRPEGAREPPPQGSPPLDGRHLQEVAASRTALEEGSLAPRARDGAFPKARRVRKRSEYSANSTVRPAGHVRALHPARRGAAAAGRASHGSGLIVTKKVGNAVARARIKRLCRECFRAWKDLLPDGVDLVVIAKNGADLLSLADVHAEWSAARGQLRKRAAETMAQAGGRAHASRPEGAAEVMIAHVFLAFIRLYQRLLSPILRALMGPACRFEPSCSRYAAACIEQPRRRRRQLAFDRTRCVSATRFTPGASIRPRPRKNDTNGP